MWIFFGFYYLVFIRLLKLIASCFWLTWGIFRHYFFRYFFIPTSPSPSGTLLNNCGIFVISVLTSIGCLLFIQLEIFLNNFLLKLAHFHITLR